MSSYTSITLFDECSYRKLYSVLGNVNFDNLCRVPYGRVSDDLRCLLDTLPLHFTISSSKDGLSDIMEKMRNFSFCPFEVVVDGIDVMKGKVMCNISRLGRIKTWTILEKVSMLY